MNASTLGTVGFSLDVFTVAQAVAIIVGCITICGVLYKIASSYISAKWKADTKDYVVFSDLKTFCASAQSRCPRATDMAGFSEVIKAHTETMKEVVREQKILRQDTLPKEYVNMPLFNNTIVRIENSILNAVTQIMNNSESTYKRINEVTDQLSKKIDDVKDKALSDK